MSTHLHSETTTMHGLRLTLKDLVLGALQAICLLSVIAQGFIDASEINLLSSVMVGLSSTLLIQYLWHSDAMVTNPLSSLALLGFTASSQLVALMTQTLDGTAFTAELRAPLLTFSILGTVHIVAVLVHFVFRKFTPLSEASAFLGAKIFGPMRAHEIPTPLTLWALAAIGSIANISGGGGFGDVSGKFLAGFAFLIWAPFLIPLYHDILGDAYCKIKKQLPIISTYTIFIVGIALVKNHRAMMFLGPMQLAFMYFLHKSRTHEHISSNFLKRATIVGVLGIASMSIFGDLMVAMEIVRGKRTESTPMEMLKDTYETFLDKPRLEQQKAAGRLSTLLERYDEVYLRNPMLNRMSETKFHDNMLYFGAQFSESDRAALIDNTLAKTLSIIPQNIIDFFEIKFDKNKYVYSNGDFYLNQSLGTPLGGYATGSMWADLYVIAGPWLPLTAFAIILIALIPMDAMTRFGPGIYISPAALCSTWPIFLYGIGGESLSVKINQILRGTVQLMILYAIALWAVTHLIKFFNLESTTPIETPEPLP